MSAHLALRSGNPALRADTFATAGAGGMAEAMTVQGTVNKTALSLLLLVLTATFTWTEAMANPASPPVGWILVGGLGGLVVALVTVFRKTWAPYTTPAYALLEGLALGAISATFESRYPLLAKLQSRR